MTKFTETTDVNEEKASVQSAAPRNIRNSDNGKIHYGYSEEVNRLGFHDFNEYSKKLDRKQSMDGFDPQYVNIVDYIMKITHQIWEERGIGIIYKTYHNNVTMHCGSLNLQGMNAVISNTLQTLHAFPDRRLIGGNVVWSGDDKAGFYSSHRINSTATNLGDSTFGASTGKRVNFRTIVDCAVHSNRIYEEWLVRDNLHIVQQLGLDPHEVARGLAKNSKLNGSSLQLNYGLSETMNGQLMPALFEPKSPQFEIGEFILDLYNKIWEWRLFNQLNEYYADQAVVHYICDKDLVGYDQIQGMLVSLFASFPNAKFLMDRVTCNPINDNDAWDVSVRWRLQGLHEGIGYFGQPSWKPVEIPGITQLRVIDGKVVEEWMTFDGLDVLKQINLNTDDDIEMSPLYEQ
ncbi:ester cyclase [Peribacillus muralis]|uniref:ester cyclase n=1 Tax=Peribacillus muralis TaxID=264697 RepID=UPI0007D7D285|nr:ester cyclase [Peribacillus muralis]